MENEVIQFIGVSDLEPEEQSVVNRLSTEYYDKLKRQINNMTSLKVHVKVADKEGNRKRFDIHTHLIAPTRKFSSTKAQDWDLPRTLHKSFQDLENQIRHALHTDETRPKER